MRSVRLLLWLAAAAVLLSLVQGVQHTRHEYIIVGAGPAGIQLGYFMKQNNHDYLILERADTAGSFFKDYPRHGMVISINKRNTGRTNKEFNLRHDWNSLISHDDSLQVRHYSRDFFPQRDVIRQYFSDYQQKLGINVQFHTEVRDVLRRENMTNGQPGFTMSDQHGHTYSCRYLVLATGIWKANIPEFEGSEFVEGYEDIPVDGESFEGENVLILGRGNSAFEVADRIYGNTNMIHMVGRSRLRLSWATHYVGDLRAVNNNMLDTYQLKSLDGVVEVTLKMLKIVKGENGKLYMQPKAAGGDEATLREKFDNFALRVPYDRVIRCLGFQFDDSLFHKDMMVTRAAGRLDKFPAVKHNYESADYPDMFYAGTNTHSLDHRKSAGGFIHGFRYTARTLHRLLEVRNHGNLWPTVTRPVSELVNTFVKRINEASGIYQMYNMLGDVAVFRNGHEEFEYFEEFPLNLLPEMERFSGRPVDDLVVLSLEYGANFSGPAEDIFRLNRANRGVPSLGHTSNFLHPVFYYYKHVPTQEDFDNRKAWETLPRPFRIHHVVEDFLTAFDAPNAHYLPFRRYIENVINEDMRHYRSEDCFEMAMTNQETPLNCRTRYLDGQGNIMDNLVTPLVHLQAITV